MKKIILLIACSLISISSYAIQDGGININGGVGVFGSRGMIGVSGEKFLTQNHALSIAFGVDFVGATSLIGYKYFSGKINNSNSIWDKCFFVFECDSHLYVGPSIQYAGSSTIKITDGADIREYQLDPKWFGLLSFGFRNVFKNNITFDTEISYRSIFSGGKSVQTSGGAGDDTHSIELGYRNWGFNLGIGYLF